VNISAKQLAEILGVIAIVASLVLVASELRQSNRIAIATAEAELRASQREVNSLRAENPELAEILVKARDPSSQLNPIEEEIVQGYAAAQFAVLSQANASQVNGLLSDYSIEVYSHAILTMLDTYPLFAKYWAEIASDSEFRRGMTPIWDSLLDALTDRGYEF